MRISACIAAALLAAGTTAAYAQQQKVTPPIAVYWMSVDTTSGFPMGGAGGGGGVSMMDIGRMMMGGGPGGGAGGNRTIVLELGSQRAASGAPAAAHEIPSGLRMGASLPLVTPQRAQRTEPREDGMPENFEKPRGRMLIFWGCGEQAGAGQPYVIDFAKLAQGQMPQGLTTRRVNMPRGPALSRSKTYGDWPNQRDSTRVPAEASLRGDHAVKGNYSPDIRFSLGDTHDFMEPVNLAMRKSGGGGMNMSWNAITHAHGYFASAMGGNERTEDVAMWTSSNTREFGNVLMNWLPPSEVARLVREKAVMPPSTTECTVPAQFVAAAPSAFVSFIAYGDEANFVHPPRPQDPKVDWNQEWAVKVRLKSTTAAMLGEEGPGGAGAPRSRGRAEGGAPQEPAQKPAAPAATDAVQEGLKALRGLFGR